MTTIITEADKNSYRRNFEPLVQQGVSRLLSRVMVETGIERVGGERHFVDQVGRRELQQITVRHPDSPHVEQEFKRRAMILADWHDGVIIDKPDIFRTLDDPTNPVVMEQRKGAARRIDRTIIEAMEGTNFVGHDGTTPVALPASQIVEDDYHESAAASGNVNLTVGKIRRASEILNANEADEDRTLVVSANNLHAMLTDPEITSVDFNAVKALINGEINMWMGFNWVRTELLTKVGTKRNCLAWGRSHTLMGFARTMEVHLDPARSDKSFNPYAYIRMSLASTRLEEEGVVLIECDETNIIA